MFVLGSCCQIPGSACVLPFPPGVPLCPSFSVPKWWGPFWGMGPYPTATAHAWDPEHPAQLSPYGSTFFLCYHFQLMHILFLIHTVLFLAKLGSSILRLPAELWSFFLTAPISRHSLCYCIAFSCRDPSYLSFFIFFQLCFFLLSSKWLCLIFFSATVCLQEMGFPFYVFPKKEMCWELEDTGSNFGNVSFSIWPRNYISLSEQDGAASWILSVWSRLGKVQSVVFPFCCLVCFGFLYLCYNIWKEEAVYYYLQPLFLAFWYALPTCKRP